MFEVISTFKNEFFIIYRQGGSYLAPAFINHNVENLLDATGDTYLGFIVANQFILAHN